MRGEHHDTDCLDDRENIFSNGQLWEELEHPNPARRASALAFVDALADLAALRARRPCSSFLMERHRSFNAGSIIKEMQSDDAELAETAARVLTIAMMVNAVVDSEAMPTTDAIRRSASKLIDATRKRLAEMTAVEAMQRGAEKS